MHAFNRVFSRKPDAGNPHVRFDEGGGGQNPSPTRLVLSAWDLAPKEAKDADPDDYLSAHLPLLHDFLSGNPLLFCSKTFGVSITGGVLTDDDTPFMKKYLQEDPNKTGYVSLTSGKKVLKSGDLTLPLAWAFGCECPEFGEWGIAKP